MASINTKCRRNYLHSHIPKQTFIKSGNTLRNHYNKEEYTKINSFTYILFNHFLFRLSVLHLTFAPN